MNINQFLKSIGKTKTELAEELRLSRPTLNQYIELFDTGHIIENERYEIIFERLFSDRQVDRERFEEKVDAIRHLLERDEKYDIGCLKPEAADIVARIHNNMVHDMSKETWNRKVYDTILILLNSYNNNVFLREFAGYIADLNSDSDLSDLTTQSKAYYSYYYKCFHEIHNNPPELDLKLYDEFINHKAELSQERTNRKIEITNKVKEKLGILLKEVEEEFQKKGIEASESEIMTEVIRRMNRINEV